MRKYIYLIFIIPILIGCQPILRTITGIKKPKVENFNSIENYIETKNLPINKNKNYYLSSNDDLKKLLKLRDTLFQLPDVYLFNKEGAFLDESSLCLYSKYQNKDNSEINYFNKIYNVDSIVSQSKKVFYLEELLTNSKGENAVFAKDTNIAIILWAKFLGGKRNLKHITESKRSLEESENPISLYYLNVDALESWEE